MKNRIIKFRAWNLEDEIMDYFDLAENFDFDDYRRIFKRVNPILMQFTGLLDKNGKEIYEGDVVKYCYHNDKRSAACFTGEVVFGDWVDEKSCDTNSRHVGFYLRGEDNNSTDKVWFTAFPEIEDIEVIGNIYENPELLNK